MAVSLRCADIRTMVPVVDLSEDEVDEALVARIACGDRIALAKLYERYAPALLGLGRRIVHDRRTAEDLLHDVFVEVWRAAKTFDPERGRVRTWLFIRMRCRALDVQKSARVTRNEGDAVLATLLDDRRPVTPDHARVRDVLATLEPPQRRLLELAYFEGLSCADISARLAMPLGTVKSRLGAALAGMRAGMNRRVRRGAR